MVVVYPLSMAEDIAIRWAACVVPVVATAGILLLTAVTVASAQV